MQPVQEKQTKMVPAAIIPRYLWRCLQIIGLLPVPYSAATENAPATLVWYLRLYAAAIISLFAASLFIISGNYAEIYSDQLEKLEFFTLVSIICTISSQLQVFAVMLTMYAKGHRIPGLLYELHDVLSLRPKRKLHWLNILPIVALIWIMLTFAAPFADVNYTMNVWDNYDAGFEDRINATWNSPEYIMFGLIVGPSWLWIALDTVQQAYRSIVIASSQMLSFLIVFAIGKAFAKQVTVIEKLEYASVFDAHNCRKTVRRLLGIVYRFNDIFSWINFVVCMQDLINLVHYIAMFLQQVELSSDDEVELASMQASSRRIHLVQDANMFVLSVVHLVLRFSVCCYCHEQGQKLGFLAQQHGLQTDDRMIRDDCQAIREALLSNNGTTISAGGFAYITKEYLGALVGLFFTYFILIYQARDSKQDLRQLKFDLVKVIKLQAGLLRNGSCITTLDDADNTTLDAAGISDDEYEADVSAY